MNIGRITGIGIGTASALTACSFVKKLNMEYCVDDVYGNDPSVTGKTWKRVMCEDGSDMPHDIYVDAPRTTHYPSPS